MDKITLQRIKLLHPALHEEATKIYADICAAMPAGVMCRFSHTLRTKAEQDALYAIGRSKKGKVVTNARGGSSYHNYGLAIDFCLLINGQASFVVDTNWMAVINIFETYNWESGHWWRFKDSPHVQKTFGKTIAQLRAAGKTYPDL